MKVILTSPDMDPGCQIECDCGEQFWVDPCGEQNLVFNGKELIPKCPKCGKEEKHYE